MAIVHPGLVQQSELDGEVQRAREKLSPADVVRVAHSVEVDSTGDPSISFRVVLTDFASKPERLAETTSRVATVLFEELRPYERWGLIPYFSFRSKSEQDARNDPGWS